MQIFRSKCPQLGEALMKKKIFSLYYIYIKPKEKTYTHTISCLKKCSPLPSVGGVALCEFTYQSLYSTIKSCNSIWMKSLLLLTKGWSQK